MTAVMQGRRVPDGTRTFAAGDYGRIDGEWWVWPAAARHMGRLTTHKVTEHEDGTITVSPSIVIEKDGDGEGGWHGFLARGVWTRL